MMQGGGAPLLSGNSRWVGPGGESVLMQSSGQDIIVFHAYDAHSGFPALQISTLVWRNGWPHAAVRHTRREDRWADLFVEQRSLAETKNGNPSGPYMFLFSDYEQLFPFEQFLRRELPQLNPSPWSIFYVASQEEFTVHRFTR